MKIKKLVGAGIAALALVAFQGAPASAVTGAGVFVGNATLVDATGSGLNYPVSPACGAPVGLCPNETGTWTLSIDTGVGVSDVASGFMDGTIAGKVGPNVIGIGAFCGVSGGSDGAGTISIGASSTAINGVRWLTSAATVIVFDNATTKTSGPTMVGVASAIPPAPVVSPNSCLNGTAKDFTVVGAAAMAG